MWPFEGGDIELEQLGSADSPLAVHCVHHRRRRLRRGDVTRPPARLAGAVPAAAAHFAAGHGVVSVCASLWSGVAEAGCAPSALIEAGQNVRFEKRNQHVACMALRHAGLLPRSQKPRMAKGHAGYLLRAVVITEIRKTDV